MDVAVPSQFAFIASQISSPPAALLAMSVLYDEGREEGVFGGQMQFASPLPPSLHRHRGFGRLERFRQSYYRASRSLVLVHTTINCTLCTKPLSPEASPPSIPFHPLAHSSSPPIIWWRRASGQAAVRLLYRTFLSCCTAL